MGRLGVVRISDTWRIWYGTPSRARAGFGRLVRLGILRSFPRPAPSFPKWFALTARAREWVIEETGCAESEVRAPSGIARMNLTALAARNRFWVSLILACRGSEVELVRFMPEGELRRTKPTGIVPDALVVLRDRSRSATHAWAIELDAGGERLAVWAAKARGYVTAQGEGSFYGLSSWRVLALVPSLRRARSVAQAVAAAGAGSFTYLVEGSSLDEGRALELMLMSADELAEGRTALRSSLVELTNHGGADPDQQLRSTADRTSATGSLGSAQC